MPLYSASGKVFYTEKEHWMGLQLAFLLLLFSPALVLLTIIGIGAVIGWENIVATTVSILTWSAVIATAITTVLAVVEFVKMRSDGDPDGFVEWLFYSLRLLVYVALAALAASIVFGWLLGVGALAAVFVVVPWLLIGTLVGLFFMGAKALLPLATGFGLFVISVLVSVFSSGTVGTDNDPTIIMTASCVTIAAAVLCIMWMRTLDDE